MPTTTVAGVRFSPEMAALLEHAIAHGFRIEADTRRTATKNAVKVYAPDKSVSPMYVAELRAKFNPAHTDNVRRQLAGAGMPPMDLTVSATEMSDTEVDDALADLPEGAVAIDLRTNGDGAVRASHDLFADPERSMMLLDNVVTSLTAQMGLGAAERELVSALTMTATQWSKAYSADRLNEAVTAAVNAERVRLEREVNEALRMAAEHEATIARLTTATERAQAKETEARRDCGAALRRAEQAETEAARLRAALAPLRELLGKES